MQFYMFSHFNVTNLIPEWPRQFSQSEHHSIAVIFSLTRSLFENNIILSHNIITEAASLELAYFGLILATATSTTSVISTLFHFFSRHKLFPSFQLGTVTLAGWLVCGKSCLSRTVRAINRSTSGFYQRVSIASYANRWYSQRRNVRLSVRLSVTLRYCIKTKKARVVISSPPESLNILVCRNI